MKEKFQLRNGEGNGAPFANLTSKGLMGPSLDTDPIKTGEIPFSGSKKAEQQKADLAKVGVEKEVKLKPNELGVYSGDKDLGVKKYTSFYKTSDPKLKEKGNKYWSSLSETDKQKIRDKKSRYTQEPIPMVKIPAKPIKTSSSLDIKRVPLKTPGDKPSREIEPVFKTKKEIKEHVFNQYGGISRDRLSLYKKGRTNRRIPASFNTGRGDIFGKVATAVAGKKQVFKDGVEQKERSTLVAPVAVLRPAGCGAAARCERRPTCGRAWLGYCGLCVRVAARLLATGSIPLTACAVTASL